MAGLEAAEGAVGLGAGTGGVAGVVAGGDWVEVVATTGGEGVVGVGDGGEEAGVDCWLVGLVGEAGGDSGGVWVGGGVVEGFD